MIDGVLQVKWQEDVSWTVQSEDAEADGIMPPQINVEDADLDLEILDAPPAIFKALSKKKTLKVKEKLDDSFLRRSKRISNKLQGFNDAESTKKANATFEMPEADIVDATPLAIISPGPSSGAAPTSPRKSWRA